MGVADRHPALDAGSPRFSPSYRGNAVSPQSCRERVRGMPKGTPLFSGVTERNSNDETPHEITHKKRCAFFVGPDTAG